MKIHFIMILSFLCSTLKAQNTEWASTILSYSSERSPLEYSITQILGKPNAMPPGGDNPNAWSPAKPNKNEYVAVGFEHPMKIKQLAIAESFQPGAIKAAYAIDMNDTEILLFELNKEPSGLIGSMFNFFMPLTEYEVKGIKLILDGNQVEGYFNIDAIAISDSEFPIDAEVNVHVDLKSDLIVEPLDASVNSNKNELRPLLSPDGSQLFFTRQFFEDNQGGENDRGDIWVSTYDPKNNTWLHAQDIGPSLNNSDENFMAGLSKQGKGYLALVGQGNGSSSTSHKKMSLTDNLSGEWRQPVEMEFVMDPEFNGNMDLSMSSNRRSMVIATELDDSHGSQDIYVSFLQRNGLWSDPLNLGDDINTVGNESSPFLASDGRTMYFSSNGYSGMGGRDIYKSVRLDDSWRNWSEPENLGPKINSAGDDLYFTIPETGKYAYFSRFVTADNADVFKVELPLYKEIDEMVRFEITIIDHISEQPVEAQVYIADLDRKILGSKVEVDLEPGSYTLDITSSGFYPKSDTIDLTEIKGNFLSKTYMLEPIDSILTFNQIRFESNDKLILEESFHDLNEVVKILKKHPALKLKIASHTDNVGSHDANLLLSEMRGRVVLHYLIAKGIDESRLILKWYGESRPLESNDTPEGRMRNRRVEFEVIEE